jgi:hypothetical protein
VAVKLLVASRVEGGLQLKAEVDGGHFLTS